MSEFMRGFSLKASILKRSFDLIISGLGLILFSWLILLLWLIATLETRNNGFFRQKRIGRHKKLFSIVKIRTMKEAPSFKSSVTTYDDPRITFFGKFLRRYKLDELPTLWNVLRGDMSIVGPRPDVPGYADKLKGEDRRILELRSGITGPATLKYASEGQILANVNDPIKYNNEVIFPDKVRINLEYMDNWSLWTDIKIVFKTIFRKNY